MAMAGPSPHVPSQPLVPHSVPPLSSTSLCPDLTPRSAIPQSSSPLQTSDSPRSEHLQPSAPACSALTYPDPVAAGTTASQFSSDHPSLSQLPRRRASKSGRLAAAPRSSSLAAANPAAGTSAGLHSSDQHLFLPSPHLRALSSSRSSSKSFSYSSAVRDLPAAVPSAAAGSSAGQLSSQSPSSSAAARDPSRSELSLSPSHSSALPPSAQQPCQPALQQAENQSVPPELSAALPHQLVLPAQQSSTPLASALAGSLRSAAPPFFSATAAPPSGPATPAPPCSAAPQQQSYAQVARKSRGNGFVRAHASDVESFARLPRTGVNIICGSREGMPSFSFVNSELPKVEELYANALVMKFHGGRPSLEASHKEIQSWGIVHPFSIGPLSSRAFLLRFQDNMDLMKVLSRPSSLLISFSYKVYRWHNLCHMKEDSCFAPVWVSLPRLPLQCFIPEFLESVGNKIGRFLCFDKATTTLARPSAARICVEIDLRKAPPPFIWIGLFEGLKQQIMYERLPKYCNHCHVIGHVAEECHKSYPAAPPCFADQRVPLMQAHTTASRHHTPSIYPTSQQRAPAAAATSTLPPPQSPLFPPSSAAPSPSGALLQVQPTAALLQQAPAATAPSTSTSATTTPAPIADHLQIQPSTNLLQRAPAAAATLTLPPPQSPLIPPSTAAPSTSDALPQVQPTAVLLQRATAETAPSVTPPTSSATTVPVSEPIAPPVVQPTTPLKPLPSSTPKKLKGKQKCKSVSFALPPTQQQLNIQANSDFWEAANRHIAFIEQARLTSSSANLPKGLLSLASADPILSIQPHPIQVPPSSVESDSGSSIAADSPPSSPIQDAQDPSDEFQSISYKSEGEDPAESSHFSGHNSDDLLSKKPHRSKRNKRHPNQPLKVQLRVRKSSTSLC